MQSAAINLLAVFSASLVASVVGAILSILAKRSDAAARGVAGIFGIIASLFGIAAAALMIFGPEVGVISFTGPFLLSDFSVQFNALAGLLIGVISLLALASWIYSFSYVKEYKGKAGTIGFFMNLFIPAMCLVIVADNAFWFVVFFEVMSLTSYFLVIIDQDAKASKAGLLYLIMSHCGLVLVMFAFFLMASQSHSLSFSSFRALDMAPFMASSVFLLTFVGFGFKAGLVPFHSWLPLAHPSAPSHVSALMSGGMIKIGIFGIVKMTFDILSASGGQAWWGIVVLIIGALSSVLGVAYALVEHDIKRLLAYHSCENVGIIALGVGAAIIGWTSGLPLLMAVGLMAGLYHLFNHAVFKALLFLGAGSVMYRTHTKNMELMGGLSHKMPVTAFCFLIGSLAISAIPPLNGFVSEWFTYQSLFNAALGGDILVTIVAVVSAVALALTGALAVTCFVKAYGVTFSGAARSEAAHKAKEAPTAMLVAMGMLALVCVIFGLGAPVIAPVMQQIAASTASVSAPVVAQGVMLEGIEATSGVSTPIIAVLLVGTVAVIALIKKLFSKKARQIRQAAWACGYKQDNQMPVIASSFAENVSAVFHPLYALRDAIANFTVAAVDVLDRRGKDSLGPDRGDTVEAHSAVALAQEAETGCLDHEEGHDTRPAVVDSVVRLVEVIGDKIRHIEGGNYCIYCLYIMLALVALLLVNVLVG